jgi:Raf kinase inhibitor-like YbhB/YbcL family protein
MRRLLVIGFLAGVLLAGCGGGDDEAVVTGPPPSAPDEIRLTSPAFEQDGTIPERFTCDGEDTSPPLEWSGVSKEAAEFALLVEDPDAPGATFVHWLLLGIDRATRGLAEGETPPGAEEAKTSFGDEGYGGPCPPEGDDPHRYVFTLYALQGPLDVDADASPAEVRAAIGEAALARGQLTGRYGR